MDDEDKTKEQLIYDLTELRQQIAEVEASLTELKRLEKKLQKSEAGYHSFLQNFHGIVFQGTMDYTTVFAHGAIEEITGYKEEEITSGKLKWYHIIHPDDFYDEETRKKIQSMPHYSHEREYRIIRKDGEIRWIKEFLQNVCDELGKPCLVQGVQYDITGRRQVEETLRKSESKYRTLLENLPQKIFHKDRNSVYVSCNENYARDLKINSVEIVGKTDYDFYPKELAEKYRKDDKRVMELGTTEDLVENYITDGREEVVQTVKTPIKDEKGNTIGILGIFWDITEKKLVEEALKKSEKRFRNFLDNLGDAAYETDSSGNITYSNKMGEIMSGVPLKDIIGTPFLPLFTRESQEIAIDVYQRTLKGESTEFELTFTSGRICHFKNRPLRDKNGKIIGVFGIARDITERTRLEKSLSESETHMRSILDSLPDVILQVDINLRILWANKTALKMNPNALGYTCYEGYPGREQPCDGCPCMRAIETGKIEVDTMYFPLLKGMQDESYWELIGVPLKDSQGRVTSAIEIARNVTDRIQVEKEMRKTKDYLNNIIESSLEGILVTDEEGNITRVNKALAEMLCHKKEELVGKFTSVLTPKRKERYESITGELIELNQEYYNYLKAINKTVIETGKICNQEVYYVRSDKKIVYVEASVVCLYNEKGDIVGTVTMIRDITERKKREREIKETRDFLENVFRTSVDGIITSDSRGFITSVNEATEKIFGYSENELLGKHTTELAPKGTKYEERTKEIGAMIKKQGSITGIDYPWLRKDGSQVDIEMNITLLKDKEGNTTGATGVIRDITERKKREKEIKEGKEFLENIFATSADGILVGDSEGNITMINEAAERMLGYSKDELIGRHPIDLGKKDKKHRDHGKKVVEEVLRKGFTTGVERTWIRKDGSLVDVEINLAFLKDDKGNIVGSMASIRDITERKRTDEALRKVNKCLLSFGPDPDKNIKKIIETTGLVLEGVCALYSKEEGSLLCIVEGWHISKDFKRKVRKEGRICYDIIRKHKDKPVVVYDFDKSPYAKAVPNIDKYKLKTYIGCAVKISDKTIGSLCVVYQENKTFSANELNILSILAKALAVEEERKKALEELTHHQQMLKVSERNLKEFSRKILSVREEEGKKLSHSLHDEVGSMTVALSSNLSIAEEEMKDNNVQGVLERINQTKSALKESVEKLKQMSINLRPPNLDIVGLPSVLRDYFSTVKKQTKIKIDFSVSMDKEELDDDVAIVLYRVTQEALNNIVRHAGAKRVKIRLSFQGNNIKLTIRDDGKGFDVEKRLQKTTGLGVRGMKERVESLRGTFIITSAVKKGTDINVTIPHIKEYKL